MNRSWLLSLKPVFIVVVLISNDTIVLGFDVPNKIDTRSTGNRNTVLKPRNRHRIYSHISEQEASAQAFREVFESFQPSETNGEYVAGDVETTGRKDVFDKFIEGRSNSQTFRNAFEAMELDGKEHVQTKSIATSLHQVNQRSKFDKARAKLGGDSNPRKGKIVVDNDDVGGRLNTVMKGNGPIENDHVSLHQVNQRNKFDVVRAKIAGENKATRGKIAVDDDDVKGRVNTLSEGQNGSLKRVRTFLNQDRRNKFDSARAKVGLEKKTMQGGNAVVNDDNENGKANTKENGTKEDGQTTLGEVSQRNVFSSARTKVVVDNDDVGGRLNTIYGESNFGTSSLMGPEWDVRSLDDVKVRVNINDQTSLGQVYQRNKFEMARAQIFGDNKTSQEEVVGVGSGRSNKSTKENGQTLQGPVNQRNELDIAGAKLGDDNKTNRGKVLVDDDDVGGRLHPVYKESDSRTSSLMGPEWNKL